MEQLVARLTHNQKVAGSSPARATMNEERKIEYDIADIVTGIPHEFNVGRKLVRLYPVTLAKIHMLSRYIGELNIDRELLSFNPYMEALRLASEKTECCCRILSIHATPNTYKDLCNSRDIAMRRNLFLNMKHTDIATIMVMVLTSNNFDDVIKHLGIDKEHERLLNVLKMKKEHRNNKQSFGGISIFGNFIGKLKEMGFTTNEILYERSYLFLQLMIADKVVDIYLSDEELNSISEKNGGNMLDGNDPSNFDKVAKQLSGRGLKIEE